MLFSCCHCGELAEKPQLVVVPKNRNNQKLWMKQFNLCLNIVNQNENNYVCKSHLSKIKQETEILPSALSPDSEVYVKQEEPFQESKEFSSDWPESMNEPMEEEVDYDQFKYEEDPIHHNFEEDNQYNHDDYNADCQPTTSSAITPTFRPIHGIETNKTPNFERLPVYIPELSDNQVLSFCVKTSSNISGSSSFECGMCPEVFFNNTGTKPIRHHLHSKHLKTIKHFLETGRAPQAPKTYAPMAPVTRMMADEALCKFLIKNGIPLKAVQDRNLEMLAFNMNSEYALPTEDTLFEHLQQIVNSRENTTIETHGGPITVTFDTTSFNNAHYLVYTVHFYKTNKEMKRSIFFQEMETAQPSVQTIIATIRKKISESDARNDITTVVSGSATYEDGLEEMQSFNQVMVCFSQNINKFADALIDNEIFFTSLKKLRDFIGTFPLNREIWEKFKHFLLKKRSYGEYPELDIEKGKENERKHWFCTLDFITKCLHMHRIFSDFLTQYPRFFEYIGVEDNVNIVYLHSLLSLCKSTLQSMVDANATIADVIPAIADINASLHITTSDQVVVNSVNALFNRLLIPFVEQSDVHRFALYLHPLRHGVSMLPPTEWTCIKASIARQLSLREAAKHVPSSQLGQLNGLPTLRDTAAVDKEVANYSAFVSRLTVIDSDIMDWWRRYAHRFPILYEYACELFQIPAFSIDAAFYLGDWGLLTHSINETEISKRKILLEASSELVDFRSKGEVMSKTICVRRKRDATCTEDSWYAPVDKNALMAGKYDSRRKPFQVMHPMTSKSYSNRISQSIRSSMNTNPNNMGFGRSLKQEIEKMGTFIPPKQKVTQKVYRVASSAPYAIPTEIKQEVPSFNSPSQTVPARKYYAARPLPQRFVNPRNGLVVQESKPSETIIVPKMTAVFNRPPQSNKVYFVRSKTGATRHIQRPPY